MKQKIIKRIIFGFLFLFLAMCSCLYFYPEPERVPYQLRYYSDEKKGFMQFEPETILNAIEQGEPGLFSSMEGWYTEAEHPTIKWSQAQFIRVANALSQQVWDESLDFDHWDVYSFRFLGGYCDDNIDGFFGFDLIYYQTLKSGMETIYTARTISITPYEGKAIWAEGEFSVDFFQRWRSINLVNFQIAAEQAHQIAEKNGGRDARMNQEDCNVFVDAENYWLGDAWRVRYVAQIFDAYIDPFNGKVRLRIK